MQQPATAQRTIRLFLLLSAAFSGLHAVILTVIPGQAAIHELTASGAGILLALLALAGLAVDGVVGNLVARWGVKATISAGIAVLAAGAVLLFGVAQVGWMVVAVLLLGLGLGLLTAPILGGLAATAAESQIAVQTLNVTWQRLGTLVASLFLVGVLEPANSGLSLAAMVMLLVTLAMGTAALSRRGLGQAGEKAPSAQERLLPTLRASPLLRAGVALNVAVPTMLIVGSSFYPIVLLAMDLPELLVPGLIGRELLGLAAVWAASVMRTRDRLDRMWAASAVVGVAALVMLPSMSEPLFVVILFALHGPAMCLAILLGNIRAYDGTNTRNRFVGFAASAFVMRTSSIIVPLALGFAIQRSVHLAMMLAAVTVLGVLFAYARFVSTPP